MKLTTSVVLTTYNGMQYIEPLMDSLRLQSRKIDEVCIYDDGSKDQTVDFLRSYIKKYHLSEWRVELNKENKGWKKNFRDGILAASGDLIFPCDQDDIWNNQKIERMAEVFEKTSNIQLLSSDYQPLYEAGGAKVDLFGDEKYGSIEHIKDDEKFAVHMRPGCVMCVRRTFAQKLVQIWGENYAHDAFLWTAATLSDGNYLLREPLIQYRRHSSNASTGQHRTIKNQIELMEMGRSIIKWYMANDSLLSNEKKKVIDGFIKWCDLREDLLEKNKFSNFIKLISYRNYYRSLRQEIGDLYYLLKKKEQNYD